MDRSCWPYRSRSVSTKRWVGTLTSTVSPFWARKRVGANQVTYSDRSTSCSSRSRTCFQTFIGLDRSIFLKIHNFSTVVENLCLWKTGGESSTGQSDGKSFLGRKSGVKRNSNGAPEGLARCRLTALESVTILTAFSSEG